MFGPHRTDVSNGPKMPREWGVASLRTHDADDATMMEHSNYLQQHHSLSRKARVVETKWVTFSWLVARSLDTLLTKRISYSQAQHPHYLWRALDRHTNLSQCNNHVVVFDHISSFESVHICSSEIVRCCGSNHRRPWATITVGSQELPRRGALGILGLRVGTSASHRSASRLQKHGWSATVSCRNDQSHATKITHSGWRWIQQQQRR
jgi:hypothetical protein